jgi:hypothetical protein
MSDETPEKMSDAEVVKWILACRDEAKEAKKTRMERNANNYSMFHLEHDFSHKQVGQSKEVLSKQSMAVEQIKSFFQQALADLGEWWSAEAIYSENEQAALIRPEEMTRLTSYLLEKAKYFAHVGNSIESALLGSLAISKTSGQSVPKPKFVSRKKGRGKNLKRWVDKIDDMSWGLRFTTVRAEDYYPDPDPNSKLYEIEDMEVDYFTLLEMSEGDDAIYDRAAVERVSKNGIASETAADKSRETGQDVTNSGHRPKVKVTEFWGTMLDRDGCVVYENCVAAVANDTVLIRKPEPNPLWHQRSPYNASPLMEVANSVWHKAPMDAPTMHNRAMIEFYNLLTDAAMKQVHAISQLRKDMLDNPSQVANGIRPGMTLTVNSMLPPGAKVLESLTAVQIPAEALNIMNIMAQEFNASAMTNDLRQGVMPFRAVKATEVVEASQTITSVFQGMAKNYEARQSTPELELAWMTTAQNWDKISKAEFVSLFGPKRGEELSQLAPEDVFAATVNGFKFRVYGVSLTLAKSADFRKLMQLLQTVYAQPALLEEFVKKYDPAKLLGEIMTALDIDKYKLEIPVADQNTMLPQQPPDAGPDQGQPDMNSQQPQAGAGALGDMMGQPSMPESSFPGSPATAAPGGAQ